MNGLLIIVLLFALLWFLMIRPQQVKARQQQQMLRDVAVGDEILTVGGIYGIVQELEPEEDGGDLVVEIAEGIHVRVARKALATVVKPEPEDEEDEAGGLDEGDDEAGADEAGADEGDGPGEDGVEGSAEAPEAADEVEEVNDGQETVNPGVAEQPAAPERS